MAEGKRKGKTTAGKGTPTETDRKVLKRAEQPVSEEVPDVAGFDGGKRIEPVDLSLHGDAVTDWQDEPVSSRGTRRGREGKTPPRDRDQ